MTRSISLVLVVALATLTTASRSADELLEEAEEMQDETLSPAEKARIAEQVDSVLQRAVGADGEISSSDYDGWADGITRLRFSDGGVDDEVLPYIRVGAMEAELKEAPAAKGMAVLSRKQRFAGLQIDVLENQLVVLSGTESAAEKKQRAAAGLGIENPFASGLAGRSINGTAMFMIAYRHPTDAMDAPDDLHEVAFFDAPLWEAFVDYMSRKPQADGSYAPMKIHWNVLPKPQREPWVRADTAPVQIVATPTLLQPTEEYL